jgi:hypothetical protein
LPFWHSQSLPSLDHPPPQRHCHPHQSICHLGCAS